MTRRNFTCAVLGLLFTTLAFGAEIDDLIRSAPDHAAYPEAALLVLLDRVSVTVDNNNDATLERYLVAKLFEDRGKDQIGDITQRFNKDGQNCAVLVAQTHRPDGQIVKPEAKAIADVSAPEVYDAPAYTNAMLKVVSFPALEPNAVIEYRVKKTPKKPGDSKGFSESVLFGGYNPILKKEFILLAPKGKSFRYAWNGSGVEPKVETLGSQVRYTWTMTDIPQVYREPDQPKLDRLVPRLVCSSYASWSQVADELQKPFAKGLIADADVKKLAADLSAGKSQTEALRDIYLYVVTHVRNVQLNYGEVGYEPHAAGAVLKQKYGDCRDKTCLLITLLEQAGITAHPLALANNHVAILPAVPDPDAFDWLLCKAEINDRPICLEPFGEYNPYGSLPEDEEGGDALMFDSPNPQLEKIPASDLTQNQGHNTADVTLDAEGNLTGTVRTSARGFFDCRLRNDWRDQTPIERKQSMDRIASGIKTGATLDTFWISDLFNLIQPAEVGFRFTAPHYAPVQQGEMFVRVPLTGLISDNVSGLTQVQTRHTPLATPPMRVATYRYRITAPPGMHAKAVPDSWSVENSCCRAAVRWARTPAGVEFNAEFAVKRTDLNPADYAQFKAVADEYTRPLRREIYFVK